MKKILMKKIQMRKKQGVFLLLLLLSGCFLFGCSTQTKEYGLTKKSPITVVLWHYYNGLQDKELNQMVTEFNNTVGAEKGIVVSAVSKSSIGDLGTAIKDSANKKVGAEELPNMFQTYSDGAVELDKLDIMVDLDQYVTEEEKEEYVKAYIDGGTFGSEEKWILFPIAKSTEVMALNKTKWDRFAAETGATTEQLATWEGVAKTAKDYSNWSDGQSFFGRDAFANYMVIGSKQLGRELFSVENGKATVQMEKEIIKKLWDNYYVPYINGYYKQVGRYRTDDVKIGQIIALVGSSSGMVYFPQEVTIDDEHTEPIDYMILQVPNFENTKKSAIIQGADIGVVKSTAAAEYASIVFLKWFTETDRNLEFAVKSGYLPVKKEANQTETIQAYLEKAGASLSDIQKDTVYTAIQTVQEAELYNTGAFIGGSKARGILENSMKTKAIEDRAVIYGKITGGKTPQAAVEPYLKQENFEDWLENMKYQLEMVCE